MVITNNDFESMIFCQLNCLVTAYPIIDSDNNINLIPLQYAAGTRSHRECGAADGKLFHGFQ
jgi:hypothetical protein